MTDSPKVWDSLKDALSHSQSVPAVHNWLYFVPNIIEEFLAVYEQFLANYRLIATL